MVIGLGLAALSVPLEGLARTMEKMIDVFSQSIEFADKTQKASLALGQDLTTTTNRLAPSMQGLRGSIEGRFAAGVMALAEGMQGNTAGALKLVNQQMLTGTSHAKTLPLMARLNAVMGVSNDEMNILADNMITTGNKYGVATDALVAAVDALQGSFAEMNLAGMGSQVAGAVTQLQAELGPQMAAPIKSVMTMLLDTSEDAFGKLTALGIGNVREQLSAATTQAEATTILKDAFVKASSTFDGVVGDVGQGFFKLGVASEIFGSQSKNFSVIAKRMESAARVQNEKAVDFAMTLATLKAEMLAPLQKAFMKFQPVFVKVMDAISAIGSTIAKRFAGFISTLVPAGNSVKSFKLAILDFTILALSKLEFVFNFTKRLFTVYIPEFIDWTKKAFWEISRDGGILDKFKAGIFALWSVMAEFAQWFSTGDVDTFFTNQEDHADKMLDELRTVIENNSNTRYVPGSAGGLLKSMADEASAQEKSPMYKQLLKIRMEIASDNKIGRESNAHLSDIKDNTTPPSQGGNQFLDETAHVLGSTIEAILGVKSNTGMGESLELQRQQLEVSQVIAEETAKRAQGAVVTE